MVATALIKVIIYIFFSALIDIVLVSDREFHIEKMKLRENCIINYHLMRPNLLNLLIRKYDEIGETITCTV